jgi:hypothetical protein
MTSLWRQPAWMKQPRAPDVSSEIRWMPVVTFVQQVCDMMTATTRLCSLMGGLSGVNKPRMSKRCRASVRPVSETAASPAIPGLAVQFSSCAQDLPKSWACYLEVALIAENRHLLPFNIKDRYSVSRAEALAFVRRRKRLWRLPAITPVQVSETAAIAALVLGRHDFSLTWRKDGRDPANRTSEVALASLASHRGKTSSSLQCFLCLMPDCDSRARTSE